MPVHEQSQDASNEQPQRNWSGSGQWLRKSENNAASESEGIAIILIRISRIDLVPTQGAIEGNTVLPRIDLGRSRVIEILGMQMVVSRSTEFNW